MAEIAFFPPLGGNERIQKLIDLRKFLLCDAHAARQLTTAPNRCTACYHARISPLVTPDHAAGFWFPAKADTKSDGLQNLCLKAEEAIKKKDNARAIFLLGLAVAVLMREHKFYDANTYLQWCLHIEKLAPNLPPIPRPPIVFAPAPVVPKVSTPSMNPDFVVNFCQAQAQLQATLQTLSKQFVHSTADFNAPKPPPASIEPTVVHPEPALPVFQAPLPTSSGFASQNQFAVLASEPDPVPAHTAVHASNDPPASEEPPATRERHISVSSNCSDSSSGSEGTSSGSSDDQDMDCCIEDDSTELPAVTPPPAVTTPPPGCPAVLSDTTESTSASNHSAPASKFKLPPISVRSCEDSGFLQVLHRACAIPDAFTASLKSGDEFLIRPKDELCRDIIVAKLRELHLEFAFRGAKSENPKKLAIRGLPGSLSTDAIHEELSSLGFSVDHVAAIKTARGLFVVYVPPSQDTGPLLSLKTLCYLRVKVTPFTNRRPAQCYNCQRFGHASARCGYSPRCVKCGQGHTAKNCPRPTSEPATCALCGGPHTANFLRCPAAPKMKSSPMAKKNTETVKSSVPPNPREFPELTGTTVVKPPAAVDQPQKKLNSKPHELPPANTNSPAVSFAEIVKLNSNVHTSPAPSSVPPASPELSGLHEILALLAEIKNIFSSVPISKVLSQLQSAASPLEKMSALASFLA